MANLHDRNDRRQLLDLGPEEREAFLMAVLRRHGDRIVYATLGSEHAPPMPMPFTARTAGRHRPPEPSYEGVSRMDHLLDVITKMLADPADYCLPEFVGDDELDPMTDHWVTSVLYNANRQARRDYRRHCKIFGKAKKQPGSWLAPLQCASAEAEALARLEHQEIVARMMRLPRRLRGVARLLYDGYSITETADILGIHRTTVWRRLEEIRSPAIRSALGL